MAESTCTEFVVRRVSPILNSPNGHQYIECQIDGGTIAVWGSQARMGNIDLMSRTPPPFRVIADCIPSNWRQHDLWIYERHDIYDVEPLDKTAGVGNAPASGEPLVSADELSVWRRQIAVWVAMLEGQRAAEGEGLAGRIGNLSRSGRIPREIAALMRAVTEMRNAAEYDSKVLTRSESLAVRNAWAAVSEWAASACQ